MRSISLIHAVSLLAFTTSCSPSGSTRALPMDERTLQITFDPSAPRVGECKVKINVLCACMAESWNGPAYDFTLTGAGVHFASAPEYDAVGDVYFGVIRFDTPGDRRFRLDVHKPGESRAVRSDEFVVTVAP